MKPIKATEQDQFGRDRTFATRRDDACGKVFLAEIDSETAAPDRIEMPIY